jgi:imidazolonepropionase-like amidohydrolase
MSQGNSLLNVFLSLLYLLQNRPGNQNFALSMLPYRVCLEEKMKSATVYWVILGINVLLAAPSCNLDAPSATGHRLQAFVGATLIDGTGREALENAVVVVDEGRITQVGPAPEVAIPSSADRIDLRQRYLIPGLIDTHVHVGVTKGLESGPDVYSRENILDQLRLYASYGITTVNSLGGDQEAAVEIRDIQGSPDLDRARLLIAGQAVDAETADEARQMVGQNAEMGVDFIKIRVDDNLGRTEKMEPEVYRAVIDEAHQRGLPVAAHVFYLEDAKALSRAGADFIAHSVRDKEVDDELVSLLKYDNICYSPTLTRELSAFVYGSVPDFFKDPFFLQGVAPSVIGQLKDPERQQAVREDPATQVYKKALSIAQVNLKKLADEGVTISFGTDTGPPGRFQGYFEHLEIELMAEAALTPMQILVSATGDAARCLGLEDVGTLEPGKWADFVVLYRNPLEDITYSRTIESVWIAGNRVRPITRKNSDVNSRPRSE